MDQPTQPQHPNRHDLSYPTRRPVSQALLRVPPAPPMQIVTKGWWLRRDEQATADELEKSDNE